MKRAIYFGTSGKAGHSAIPINGSFSYAEMKEVEHIDHDSFYEVFNKYEFKISKFNNYTVFGFPASPDDPRGGSKTAVLIEGDANEIEFRDLINSYTFLKMQFFKLAKKYNVKLFTKEEYE